MAKICDGKKHWRIIPRLYVTEGLANSGAKARKRARHIKGIATPMKIIVELPGTCDNCPERFKCYTERQE